ncbi:hypothetical protein LCGC14_1064060 [marine sediment metagenome]|uniref:Uncharacterized protein n=1 Tax=marine sediment metagenome TaxID=412755 RepID=A0A0F9QR64_9ZZZZ
MAKGKSLRAVRICHHRTPPTDNAECMEMLWSGGRACKRCWVECYRRGWEYRAVLADNQARVKERMLLLTRTKQ